MSLLPSLLLVYSNVSCCIGLHCICSNFLCPQAQTLMNVSPAIIIASVTTRKVNVELCASTLMVPSHVTAMKASRCLKMDTLVDLLVMYQFE